MAQAQVAREAPAGGDDHGIPGYRIVNHKN
jgi:hypothetical protein